MSMMVTCYILVAMTRCAKTTEEKLLDLLRWMLVIEAVPSRYLSPIL